MGAHEWIKKYNIHMNTCYNYYYIVMSPLRVLCFNILCQFFFFIYLRVGIFISLLSTWRNDRDRGEFHTHTAHNMRSRYPVDYKTGNGNQAVCHG